MNNEQKIKQLEKQVQELLIWKAQKERRQLNYPLDKESLPAVTEHYVRKASGDTSTASVKYAGLDNTTLVNQRTSTALFRSIISVGEETLDKQGGNDSSLNTQLTLENNRDSATFDTFLYAYGKPLYINPSGTTISVTSGGTTMSDTTKNWTVNDLAGAMVNISNSSGVFQFSRQIASNTATEITIEGTWPASVSGGSYIVLVPTYLGAAQYPWKRLLVGGDDVVGDGTKRRAIRIGYGTTGGTETIGIFFGTGSPESVVTANVGSLYLRTDGGTSTTLYVKTSGTGSTTWTAK